MSDFSSSIIREKVTFISNGISSEDELDDKKKPVVIRSNRIALNLQIGEERETVVVRAQTTHVALTMASKIMYSFTRSGLFLKREKPYEWDKLWETLLSEYEVMYNPNIWAAVYVNGNPVFRTADSAYVDIIEKCALLHVDNYDASIEKAESVFKKLGMDMKIQQILNIAAVFNNQDKEGILRCGIIQRARGRNLTFNFVAEGGDSFRRIEQSLMIAGAFLEAINLNLVVRSLKAKVNPTDLKLSTADGRRMRHASSRMAGLYKVITVFENTFSVRYRPEKPDLFGPH